MTQDAEWMQLALDQARLGVGKTSPNPPVGAVIVKDNQCLGSGWHRAAGMPHAEREAIADAISRHGAESLHGATIYITLEPCSTFGRTPPCTDGIIHAGIKRVVYACDDPNPHHAGNAKKLLDEAEISVTLGVLESAALDLLRPFYKIQTTGLPWIIWKVAMSLDGRITRPAGEGQWLSGEASREDVQRLRATVDAILTSGATVRSDRPALTIRNPEWLEGRSQPWRWVISNHPESLPRDAPLFCDAWSERTSVHAGDDLRELLAHLAKKHAVNCVLVEAGGKLAGSLFAAGLVDEVVCYYAPLLCGGPVLALAGDALPDSIKLLDSSYQQIGDDIRLRARVARS
ncbi:MAG: bifunctional diaminohydroxyphosphoribosylaminopyrimidine deaminase/5-amino-6-(5-phosphoribosylamino)uracil reductase RibD [Verrucomicrobia bacterium]|nr:MAG: bifunctional diaminohydroxyphosphoribosylaminopyrimidine deaminase/5-amino-6-(5-phosphoribosylamino)uracil reductase RibD [Verrucomicrobiota bacterium]